MQGEQDNFRLKCSNIEYVWFFQIPIHIYSAVFFFNIIK